MSLIGIKTLNDQPMSVEGEDMWEWDRMCAGPLVTNPYIL